MAFLDNSGDIILDAVLTDTGRYRLAKADGSFRIAKFALGDDEINYRLYDKNNSNGSAYYDLSILQTPILEAFTDNAASLKSKLVSFSRNDILYMPILKLNELEGTTQTAQGDNSAGSFIVSVDQETDTAMGANYIGHIVGHVGGNRGYYIRVDQGIDSEEISPVFPLDPDLTETQYIVEIDNRLGKLMNYQGTEQPRLSYLDDDQIASYLFSKNTDNAYVMVNEFAQDSEIAGQVIRGPRGTVLKFKILASQELNTQTFLFNQLGGEVTINSQLCLYIDTTVRVIGATTGYRIDIPIRFVKLK